MKSTASLAPPQKFEETEIPMCGKEDATRFREVLVKRLDRYSLELAEEKTKLIRFGRFARRDSQRLGEGSPGGRKVSGKAPG